MIIPKISSLFLATGLLLCASLISTTSLRAMEGSPAGDMVVDSDVQDFVPVQAVSSVTFSDDEDEPNSQSNLQQGLIEEDMRYIRTLLGRIESVDARNHVAQLLVQHFRLADMRERAAALLCLGRIESPNTRAHVAELAEKYLLGHGLFPKIINTLSFIPSSEVRSHVASLFQNNFKQSTFILIPTTVMALSWIPSEEKRAHIAELADKYLVSRPGNPLFEPEFVSSAMQSLQLCDTSEDRAEIAPLLRKLAHAPSFDLPKVVYWLLRVHPSLRSGCTKVFKIGFKEGVTMDEMDGLMTKFVDGDI